MKEKLRLIVEVDGLPSEPDAFQLVAREIHDLRKKVNVKLQIIKIFTANSDQEIGE